MWNMDNREGGEVLTGEIGEKEFVQDPSSNNAEVRAKRI